MLIYRRGGRKLIADYRSEEIYNFYKERYGDEALPKEVVIEFYKRLFPEIVKLIVFDNLDYRFPARLGSLRVKKKEVSPKIDKNGNLDARRLSVNWKATKRLWEKMYPNKTEEELKSIKKKPIIREMNDHTNNYRLTWFWDKTTCNIKNQSAYYVDITRDNDNILSRAVRTNKNINFYT
jgi:hypothetical protein